MHSVHPDICQNRHRHSSESIAANPSTESKRKMHERILALLDEKDMTSKEIAEAVGKSLNAVSGRCSELRLVFKQIEVTGLRRDGAAVLRRVERQRSLFG